MGAPIASVLLPDPAAQNIGRHLRNLIALVGEDSSIETNEIAQHKARVPAVEHLQFLVRSTAAIGGGYVEAPDREGTRGRFAAEWLRAREPFAHHKPDDKSRFLQRLRSAFGFEPAGELLLLAFEKRMEIHRVLGELTLYLAERLGGLVNYGGLLEPWVWHREDEWVKGAQGKVIVLDFEANGRKAKFCVGDPAFARTWLASREFHMVQ